MTMESTVTGNFAKTSHALADKATDKVQAGIRSAQQSVQEAGDSLSSRVTDVHDRAVPIIRKTGARAQSTVQSSAPREAPIAADGKLLPENRWRASAAWLAVVEEGRVKQWRVYADNKPAYDILARSKPKPRP
jgi:hypothetical protein